MKVPFEEFSVLFPSEELVGSLEQMNSELGAFPHPLFGASADEDEPSRAALAFGRCYAVLGAPDPAVSALLVADHLTREGDYSRDASALEGERQHA